MMAAVQARPLYTLGMMVEPQARQFYLSSFLSPVNGSGTLPGVVALCHHADKIHMSEGADLPRRPIMPDNVHALPD